MCCFSKHKGNRSGGGRMAKRISGRPSRLVDHPIWKSSEAQGALAYFALVAAVNSKEGKAPYYMQLLRQVAEFAAINGKPALSDIIDQKENSESSAKKFRALDEKFRNFLRRKNDRIFDVELLDLLAKFLFSMEKGGFFDRNGISPKYWRDTLIKSPMRFDLWAAIYAHGPTNVLSQRKIGDSNLSSSALIEVAYEHFGTTRADFSIAAAALTGREKADGKARFDQKGYWACYRFSANEPGRIIKSRFVVTPPETGFSYCRFQHYLVEPDSTVRRSEGLVLPVGERIYLIGTIGRGKSSAGLKAICLEAPTGKMLRSTPGLAMSNDVTTGQKPIISKIIAIREHPAYGAKFINNQYSLNHDDLGLTDISRTDINLSLNELYSGTIIGDDLNKMSAKRKKDLLNYTIDCLQNTSKSAREKLQGDDLVRLFELAIKL